MSPIWILYKFGIADIQAINRNIYIPVPIYYFSVIDGSCLFEGVKMKIDICCKPAQYEGLKGENYVVIDSGRSEYPPSYTDHLCYKNKLANHIIEAVNRRQSQSFLDTTDEIFKDRLSLIRSKLELILLQLDQRRAISQKVLYQIDQDSCKIRNLFFDMGPHAYEIGRDRLTLERMDLDLKRQKRMEEASYFKDTGLLNKDLKDTLIQYMEEVQKSALVREEEVL